MRVMEAVWPITAVYLGPIGFYSYWKLGRTAKGGRKEQRKKESSCWTAVFKSVCHCGAGCTLGDVIAEWTVFILAINILGSTLLANYILDLTLALLLGIAFQYFVIKPMHKDWSRRRGVITAVKADTLSLVAFEIGLFIWMALVRFPLFTPPLEPTDPTFWFMMWIGMGLGFITSNPANWWLIKKGIKERM